MGASVSTAPVKVFRSLPVRPLCASGSLETCNTMRMPVLRPYSTALRMPRYSVDGGERPPPPRSPTLTHARPRLTRARPRPPTPAHARPRSPTPAHDPPAVRLKLCVPYLRGCVSVDGACKGIWFASGTPRPTAWNVRHYAHYDHVRVCPYSTAVRMPSYSALRVRDDYPKEGNQTRAQKGPRAAPRPANPKRAAHESPRFTGSLRKFL